MAFVEYPASGGAELEPTALVVALEQEAGRDTLGLDYVALIVCDFPLRLVGFELGDLIRTTLQAANSIRPASGFQVSETGFIGAECRLDFYQTDGRPLHDSVVDEVACFVKCIIPD